MRVVIEIDLDGAWTPSDVSQVVQRAMAKSPTTPLFEPLKLGDAGLVLEGGPGSTKVGTWRVEP